MFNYHFLQSFLGHRVSKIPQAPTSSKFWIVCRETSMYGAATNRSRQSVRAVALLSFHHIRQHLHVPQYSDELCVIPWHSRSSVQNLMNRHGRHGVQFTRVDLYHALEPASCWTDGIRRVQLALLHSNDPRPDYEPHPSLSHLFDTVASTVRRAGQVALILVAALHIMT